MEDKVETMDGNQEIEKIEQSVIDYLSTLMDTEHYYFLQDVQKKHKISLMYELMIEFGYDKFVPKTLTDQIKLEEFKL